MKQAIKFLLGSVLTYIVIAACSGGGGQKASPGKSGNGLGGMASAVDASSAAGGSGGTQGVVGGGPSGTEGASTDGTSVGSVGGNGDGDTGMMATITGAMTDPVPDAQADPAESGSRLKARYMVGEDGSRSFVGWYDSVRGENCSYNVASDGKTRCLPTSYAYSSYFSDAGCQQRLFATATGCPAAYGAVQVTAGTGCAAGGIEVHSLSAASPAVVYLGTPENCLETVPAAGLEYSQSTGVIAPGDFVAGNEEVDS